MPLLAIRQILFYAFRPGKAAPAPALDGVKVKSSKTGHAARVSATAEKEEPSGSPMPQNATETNSVKLDTLVNKNARCAISPHAQRSAGRFFGSFFGPGRERTRRPAGTGEVAFYIFFLKTKTRSPGRQPRTLPNLLRAQKIGLKGAPRYRACFRRFPVPNR